MDFEQELSASGGTYILILNASSSFRVLIGRLGIFEGKPGVYLYVGSAFGPGGIKARLGRHAGLSRRHHWHIDYLRREVTLSQVWYTHDPERREHLWAGIWRMWPQSQVLMPGFGSSDCSCLTHLFHLPEFPDLQEFRAVAYDKQTNHEEILSWVPLSS